ncbi:IS21 family transposase [Candidatus Aerophobetes bacterium]|nr:IS21 family transposase [Candidatus Aerophobetes bacterium]
MIKVEDKEQMRKLYFRKRWSIRRIARELHCSRKTIRRALSDSAPPQYKRRVPPPERVIGPVKPIIDSYLNEDKIAPKKQRHTVRRIFQRLVDEHTFQGSESTVKRYVRSVRGIWKEVFIPLEYDAGSTAQADWGSAYVIMKGVKRMVSFFAMKLCYSRKPFIAAFPFEKQEAFFEGHKRAFEFFEGVPHILMWDNLKTAVQKILTGRNRVEQQSFIAFRSHYLFDTRFITPGEPHENGQVENLIGYVRRNFFVPLPEVESFDELNEMLLTRCKKEDERILAGEKESIGEKWQKEREKLLPLPKRAYPCCTYHPVKACSLSWVNFDRNRYSVPVRYAHYNLMLKAFCNRVDIAYQDKTISSHERLLGKGEESLNIFHYLPLLIEKPGAFENARPVRSWKVPPLYQKVLSILEMRYPGTRGKKEFLKILELKENGNRNKLEEAIKEAIKLNALSFDTVRNILDALDNRIERVPELDLKPYPRLAGYRMSTPNISRYDLLSGRLK